MTENMSKPETMREALWGAVKASMPTAKQAAAGAVGTPTTYSVHLSTGETIEGELSMFDEGAETLRVNPPGGGKNGPGYMVAIEHVGYYRMNLKPKAG